MTGKPPVREPTSVTIVDPALQVPQLPRTPPPNDTGAPTTALVTPEQALVHFEAHRVRGLMIAMSIISLLTSGLVLLLGGDPFAARVHAIALAISGVLTSAYSIVFRDPARYRQSIASIVAFMTLGVAISGYYYWGVFSSYAAAVPITLYVMAQGASVRLLLAGTIACVVAQSGFSLATVFGYLESRGLVEPVLERAGLATQLVAIGLVQMLMVAAALAGYDAQRTARNVLDEHAKALRDLAQRDAQLAEARAEANHQLRLTLGRYSGQTIADHELGDVLGRGAMGEVYAAQHVQTGAPVAIKLLAPHLLRSSVAHERFQRECKIISSLDSPHVVKVLAISPADAAMPYIVMERLDGIDLNTMIKQQPVRPLPEIVELFRQLASGLDAAHAAGVIHRDLKPSNLLCVGKDPGLWKILDFGASKWTDGEGTLTQDHVIGTPAYMAPEQALREAVDARSDVYAMGVILYRLVTGIPAVVPGDAPSMLHEVAYRMPMQPSRVADVPMQLESVLAVALAKTPTHRFATAGELASAVAAAAAYRLPTTVFDRARRVLARSPWGHWLHRRERRSTLGYGSR